MGAAGSHDSSTYPYHPGNTACLQERERWLYSNALALTQHKGPDRYAFALQAVAEVCAVCNEARIESKEGLFRAVGAPTEAALVVLAEKLGVPDRPTHERIAAARLADPDTNPSGVQQWYSER